METLPGENAVPEGLTWHGVASSWLATAPGGGLVATATPTTPGVVAVLSATPPVDDDGYERVGDVWARALEAAELGLSGFLHGESETFFPFVCRLEEVANTTPTAVAHPTAGTLFGPFGEFPSNDEWLAWANYERLDSIGPELGDALDSPLLGWRPGEPLFEIRQGEAQILLGDLAFEHPWPSRWGTFALFSDPDQAQAMVSRGLGAHAYHHPMSFRPEMGGVELQLKEVADFLAWSRDLARVRSRTPIVIDPLAPRPFVGLSTTGSPMIRTVTGLWRFDEGNRIAREQPWGLWSGQDTLFWPGTSGVRQSTLATSTARTLPKSRPDVDPDAYAQHLWAHEDVAPDQALDAFLLCLSDSMDDTSRWVAFRSFPQAARWLSNFEAETDRPLRVNSVYGDHGLGRAGSGDAVREAKVGESLSTAFQRLVRLVASRGYSPDLADRLAAAANQVLRSVRVDVAGYARDVLWRSTDDTVWFDRLLEVLEGEALEAQAWLDGAGGYAIDGEGEALAVQRAGPEVWASLQPRSRYFVATALASLAERPDDARDSSPIALEITKALEVEMGVIYEAFRAGLNESEVSSLAFDPEDPTDVALSQFLQGRKLSLGPMTYLLKNPAEPSPLRARLVGYLEALPNAKHIRTNAFRKRLQKIAQLYRNGAAHDTPMTREVASAAVTEVIGDGAGGVLATVLASRPATGQLQARWTFESSWTHSESLLERLLDYREITDAHNADSGDGDDDDSVGFFAALGDLPDAIPSAILQGLGEQALLSDDPAYGDFIEALRLRWASQDQIALDGSPMSHFVSQPMDNLVLERLAPIGILWEDDTHVVARIAPQVIVAVEDGWFWVHGFAEDVEDGVVDACRVVLDTRSLTAMAKALSRGRVMWTHPRRLIEITQARPDDDMQIRLQRAPAPGGTISFTIPTPGAAALRQIVARARQQQYGPIRDRNEHR